MMHKFFCFWITLFLTAAALAQGNLLVNYVVRFNDDFDRGRKDRLYDAVLRIADGKSKYYMIAKEAFQPENEHDIRFTPDSLQIVYTQQTEGIMISQEYGFDGRSFFVADSLYPMAWEILPDEKQIGKLNCVKAKCFFRGRTYFAWFVPDIPVPYGPWKMGGLPGLVVDVQDSEENLVIQLKSMQESSEAVVVPGRVKYTMDKHIAELRNLALRLQQSAHADQTGNCLTCTGHSTFQFYFWEKILQ